MREDNPARDVQGPDRGTRKIKVFLYPSEWTALAECERVPLPWRQLFAIAIYTYLRASEIRGLDWPDVDLEHRVIMVHRQVNEDGKVTDLKGEEARRVPIELPLFRCWRP